MSDTRIALVGFGEVGQTLAADLLARGHVILSAWDKQFVDAQSKPSAAITNMSVRKATSASDVASGVALVISAVTAGQAVAAAQAIAPALPRGSYYIDLNSVSPGVKAEVGRIVSNAGAIFIEAAVMSPIAPKRIQSPILLGGPDASDFLSLAHKLGFSGMKVFSTEIGKASAAKMSRSIVVKGMEAILTESLLTARHFGVESSVLASLKDLFPIENWPELAKYMISRSIEHGVRRAEEMREVTQTVREAGLEPWMSAGCVERQQWASEFKSALQSDGLERLLDSISVENQKRKSSQC